MSSRHTILHLVGAALLALAPGSPAPAATSPPLVLGSYAYPGLDRVAAVTPLAELIEGATGQRVEIKLYETPDQLAVGVKAGAVDIAVANLVAWLKVAREPDVKQLAIVMPPVKVRKRYRAVLLARQELPITSLAEAAASASGLRLAAVLPGSTSGGLVQSMALAQASRAPPQWRSVDFLGSHERALAALANDDADLAAVAQAPWLEWRAAHRAQATSGMLPRVLWQSPPLPSGSLACRASQRLDCAVLAGALLRSTPATRRAALALGRGWPEWAGSRRFAPDDQAPGASFGLTDVLPQAGQQKR